MVSEIKARTTAPKAVQIAYAMRDRDTLLRFVDEVTAAFDANQERPAEAVEEVLIKWGVLCPF